MLARKAELFLGSVGSFFWYEQVMSWYTNLLPYELKLRLKHFTDRATTELTSIQNECTLASQSAVIRPEAILDYNRQYINDLPVTSPHGSDFSALRELLKLHRFKRSTRHSNATATRVASPSKGLCVRVMRNRSNQHVPKAHVLGRVVLTVNFCPHDCEITFRLFQRICFELEVD